MALKNAKITNFEDRFLFYYKEIDQNISGTIYSRYYLLNKPNLLWEWSSPLKQNHNYYYPVQRGLAVLGLEWLDFVFTSKDLHVERIYFDKELWEKTMLPQLTELKQNHKQTGAV